MLHLGMQMCADNICYAHLTFDSLSKVVSVQLQWADIYHLNENISRSEIEMGMFCQKRHKYVLRKNSFKKILTKAQIVCTNVCKGGFKLCQKVNYET